jgi:hypothetical protein
MRKPDDTPIEPVNPDAESGRQVFGRHPEALARMAVLVGLERPAPYMLLTEAETPAPNGLTPAPLPPEISNRHLGTPSPGSGSRRRWRRSTARW